MNGLDICCLLSYVNWFVAINYVEWRNSMQMHFIPTNIHISVNIHILNIPHYSTHCLLASLISIFLLLGLFVTLLSQIAQINSNHLFSYCHQFSTNCNPYRFCILQINCTVNLSFSDLLINRPNKKINVI